MVHRGNVQPTTIRRTVQSAVSLIIITFHVITGIVHFQMQISGYSSLKCVFETENSYSKALHQSGLSDVLFDEATDILWDMTVVYKKGESLTMVYNVHYRYI